MNELMHADIFFFITSIAVVAVALALLGILYYVFVILREIRIIVASVRKASNSLEKDIDHIRAEVKGGMVKVASLFNSIVGFALGSAAKRRSVRRGRALDETDSEESV